MLVLMYTKTSRHGYPLRQCGIEARCAAEAVAEWMTSLDREAGKIRSVSYRIQGSHSEIGYSPTIEQEEKRERALAVLWQRFHRG